MDRLPPRHAVARVVAALEEDIIFGRLAPRARLVEDSLMARFEAKRHVVRQALADLARMGVVVKVPNRGALVRDYTLDEVEQIYAVRELLQREAASRVPLPADPALVARVEAIHRAHSAQVAAGNLRAVYHLNNEFHETLFAACGNPYLADAVRHHAWLTHAIRSYRIGDPVLLAQARDEHGEIVEALRRGDRERLVQLCVEHVRPARAAYIAGKARGARQADLSSAASA